MKRFIFAAIAVLLCAGLAEAFVLDDFTSVDVGAQHYGSGFFQVVDGQYWRLIPNDENGDVVTESGVDVFGGSRTTTFTSMDGFFGDSASLLVGGGIYKHNTGSGYSITSMLYDGGGEGLNADFSEANGVTITFRPEHLADRKDTVLSLTLVDGDGTSQTVSRTWHHPGDANHAPGTLTEAFQIGEYDLLDVSNIYSLTWLYEGDVENDTEFFEVIAVDFTPQTDIPAPAAAVLLVSGLLALSSLRRGRGD